MTNLKLITSISIWTFLTIAACSTKTGKINNAGTYKTDTTYSASTKQLKSDKIPDSVFQMTNLRHLVITGMDCDYGDRINCWMVTDIPTTIKKLKNLKSLRLTLNAISTIPNELTELNELALIDLTDNPGLNNVDNLAKLPGLQYLYLYGCGLTKLPDNIGDLKNLKELGLAGNNLDKVEQARIKNALPGCLVKF